MSKILSSKSSSRDLSAINMCMHYCVLSNVPFSPGLAKQAKPSIKLSLTTDYFPSLIEPKKPHPRTNQQKDGDSYLKSYNEFKTVARICNLRLLELNPKKTEGALPLVVISVDCLLGLNCPLVWPFEENTGLNLWQLSCDLFSYCCSWSWCRTWWCLLRARPRDPL